jgi:diguanylate cyclase (GGDEF)-like protein
MYRVVVGAGVVLAASGLVTGFTTGRHRVIDELDASLHADAEAESNRLNEYFDRARTVALLMARNPSFGDLFQSSGVDGHRPDPTSSAVVTTNGALAYLEELYPTSIGEVCLISHTGSESARVVRGKVAQYADLSDNESTNQFFKPTMDLGVGDVYQAAPYISPDTHQWVISNSSPIPPVAGVKPAIVHFEITLESFRLTSRKEDRHTWIVEDSTGTVITDSAHPVTDGAPLPVDTAFLNLRPTTSDDGSGYINGRRVSFTTVTGSAHNANHWRVVVGAEQPIGAVAGFDPQSIGLIAFGVLIALAAGWAFRDHRRRVHEAFTDELTGVANRRQLLEFLRSTLGKDAAAAGRVALLLIDLDGFKNVNDSFGHQRGDELLCLVAERLSNIAGPRNLVARLGGDEFAVVMTQIGGRAAATLIGEQMIDAISQSSVVGGTPIAVTASIGVAHAPLHTNDPTELLRCADVAMYIAKREPGTVVEYDRARDPLGPERIALANGLRGAIAGNGLVLHYQPVVRLSDHRWVGAEALLRWPDSGLSPSEVIEIAESHGLIRALSDWVLTTALRQLAEWTAQGFDLHVAVNLSAANLIETDLVERVKARLNAAGAAASRVHIELTETAVVRDAARAEAVLLQLRKLGVSLLIDDYGTGNAGISYVRRMPVNALKIDKSFVGGMFTLAADALIVRTTIELAHGLGMTVVAEGVETAQELQELTELGCDEVQGYYFSRPVSAEEFTAALPAPAPSTQR